MKPELSCLRRRRLRTDDDDNIEIPTTARHRARAS